MTLGLNPALAPTSSMMSDKLPDLSACFLICKMTMMTILTHSVSVRIKHLRVWKVFKQCLATGNSLIGVIDIKAPLRASSVPHPCPLLLPVLFASSPEASAVARGKAVILERNP